MCTPSGNSKGCEWHVCVHSTFSQSQPLMRCSVRLSSRHLVLEPSPLHGCSSHQSSRENAPCSSQRVRMLSDKGSLESRSSGRQCVCMALHKHDVQERQLGCLCPGRAEDATDARRSPAFTPRCAPSAMALNLPSELLRKPRWGAEGPSGVV